MKNSILFIFTLVCSFAYAQVQTPKPSPAATIKQVVGLTEVTIEYSRPSMRGRTIFGGLVPYGEIWRTGANENTKITFSDDVKIGENSIPAGSYALYTKPGEKSWEIIFYSKSDNWGTANPWEEDKVVATITSDVYNTEKDIENFSIWISNLTSNSAKIKLGWEKTKVGFKIEVPTKEKAMASIEKTLSKDDAKHGDYFNAAVYYMEEKQDLEKAAEWTAMAIEKFDGDNEPFWYYHQHAKALAKLGKKKEALKAAKKSLELAEAVNDKTYIKMNNELIAELKMKKRRKSKIS